MGILGVGVNTSGGIGGFLKNPLTKDTEPSFREDDFKEGFIIEELDFNSTGSPTSKIKLVGNMMPKVPFTFGGTQQVKREFYPGNPEAAIQVLGSREDDVTINGRLYAKRFPGREDNKIPGADIPVVGTALGAVGSIGGGLTKNPGEVADNYYLPDGVRGEIDQIRQRGSICKISLGEWIRYAVISNTSWKMKRLGDIEYTIGFTIISINAPSRCPIIENQKLLPLELKSPLSDLAADLSADAAARRVPDSVPLSITDLINEATSGVAGAVQGVIDFIDGIVETAEDITNSVNRAVGIVKNAEAEISRLKFRLGSVSHQLSFAGIPVPDRYSTSAIIQSRISQSSEMQSFLKRMRERFSELRRTYPLARHRIIDSDSLQTIAIKHYANAEEWRRIFEHNNLKTTELIRGAILEIPKL